MFQRVWHVPELCYISFFFGRIKQHLESTSNCCFAGITKFKRSELETACEGFSNIIDTLPRFTLYKGTLPCGAEIAAVSTLVTYASGWTTVAEAQFKDKVYNGFFCIISSAGKMFTY